MSEVQASGGGEITFSCTGTTSVTSDQIITSNVNVIGNGGVIFDGGGSNRFFRVNAGAALTLSGLALQNGSTGQQGGGNL